MSEITKALVRTPPPRLKHLVAGKGSTTRPADIEGAGPGGNRAGNVYRRKTERLHEALMNTPLPRAARIMDDAKMGGFLDSNVARKGGLYGNTLVQPLPAPQRRRPR